MQKLLVNSGTVYRNKVVGIKQIQQLIKKPIWMVVDKSEKILDIIHIEFARATHKARLGLGYSSSFMPKSKGMKECALEKPNTIQYVFQL